MSCNHDVDSPASVLVICFQPAFFWSASSLFFSLGVYLHFSAILFAIGLRWTKSRWLYLALVGVANSHLGDLFITNIGNMADVQYRWVLHIMAVLDWVFIWSAATDLTAAQNRVLLAAYPFDAIASVITSMAFSCHLQSLHPAPVSFKLMLTLRARFLSTRGSQSEPPSSPTETKGVRVSPSPSVDPAHDGPVLYSSMHVLLRRSQELLLFEGSAMLTGILVQVVAEGTDPLWFLLFVAEWSAC
ncbi:hypothetical protein AMAG_18367 [Allomyces macrogynus ATCC 38327]|uniref:Uncharacterized protein n=1 Tax=Allomyces macrogynus (strain ATCC 38327) TaxID=578462 RepID=A0A0L0S6I9_ALLM3|nr:hypothetical protein AMAG_18367 [Allomyces macrogynus ATCC 38327]|eukprot:KNE58050.1 hypothetical protein AMAG_18367 [Allomyces macrogynus ATCC 38327]